MPELEKRCKQIDTLIFLSWASVSFSRVTCGKEETRGIRSTQHPCPGLYLLETNQQFLSCPHLLIFDVPLFILYFLKSYSLHLSCLCSESKEHRLLCPVVNISSISYVVRSPFKPVKITWEHCCIENVKINVNRADFHQKRIMLTKSTQCNC